MSGLTQNCRGLSLRRFCSYLCWSVGINALLNPSIFTHTHSKSWMPYLCIFPPSISFPVVWFPQSGGGFDNLMRRITFFGDLNLLQQRQLAVVTKICHGIYNSTSSTNFCHDELIFAIVPGCRLISGRIFVNWCWVVALSLELAEKSNSQEIYQQHHDDYDNHDDCGGRDDCHWLTIMVDH